VHFWEYMQPGYDALGFISCTGTNFLMRANAFIDVSFWVREIALVSHPSAPILPAVLHLENRGT